MATRSPRRSGGRSCGPQRVRGLADRSFDRGRVESSAGRRPPPAAPSDVSATIRCRAPYRAGRISSVMPASRTTCRPPRSRTCRTRASSQPAPRDQVAAGFDGEARRPTVRRRRVEQGRELAREPGRAGRRFVQPEDREAAADVERVEGLDACHATGRSRQGRGGPRHARHPPRRAASRRAGGSRASGAARPARRRARSRRAISISVIPNLEPPAPTARPGWVSGATSGFSRYRTSRRGPPPRRTSVCEGRRLLGRLDRDPAQRPSVGGGPRGRAQVRRRSCRRLRA